MYSYDRTWDLFWESRDFGRHDVSDDLEKALLDFGQRSSGELEVSFTSSVTDTTLSFTPTESAKSEYYEPICE